MKIFIKILPAFLFPLSVFAADIQLTPQSQNTLPKPTSTLITQSDDSWDNGLQLFAGIGVNSVTLFNTQEKQDLGIGLNIKSELIYAFSPEWAAEIGSYVRFNDTQGFLIWDTILSVGVRRTLPKFGSESLGQPYARLFLGQGPSAVYIDDVQVSKEQQQPNSDYGEFSKLQLYGTVAGMGLGFMKKEKKSNDLWFSEFTVMYQTFYKEEQVRMDADVPVVVGKEKIVGDATTINIVWSIGIRMF